jgi:hypothetical protein
MHKHRQTCRKKNQDVCRFHYPLPPMPCTKILQPLKETLSFSKRKNMLDIANRIFVTLNNIKMGVDISFEDFFNQFNLNFPIYIDYLCNILIKPTFVFKRHMKDIKTNVHAIKTTKLWETNTNIQSILDSYVVASYCTSYLTKIDKTITNELQTIIKKCENENVDANLRVRKLGNDFLNAQQMSAQVTIYIILSLPFYHASRSFSFFNTLPLSKHVFILN